MPTQTNKKGKIFYPDGALVSIKAKGEGSFTDVGAISTVISNSLSWTENQVETANAGKLDKQIKAMIMEGGFTLINLDPDSIARLSGGFLQKTVITDTPFTDSPNQTLVNGDWDEKVVINLEPKTNAGVAVKATALALDSVTGGTDGPLAADDDYTLFEDADSPSGWSIMFNLAGATLATIAQDIVIDFGSITAVASTKITGGASTFILDAVAMKITHTDDNGKIRELELYAVDMNSGGFQFNFKGANEDGVEEMPLTFTAKLDTSRISNDQLFAWTIEEGAQ